jgi:hypothetical protein
MFLLTLTLDLNAIRSTAHPTILTIDLKYLTIKVRQPYFIYIYYIASNNIYYSSLARSLDNIFTFSITYSNPNIILISLKLVALSISPCIYL